MQLAVNFKSSSIVRLSVREAPVPTAESKISIENALTYEHGDDVKLIKGAHVEVTVAAKPKTATATIDEDSQLTQRAKTSLGSGRHNSQFSYQRPF